jgi:hypothetical protein
VTDASGTGVSGLAVTFAVASGGGTLAGANATTDAGGNASVASWTLGQTAGNNSVTATIAGSPPKSVTFAATGIPGPPALLEKTAGDNQAARKGQAVPVAPAVRVSDQYRNAISGVSVTFAVAVGGGSVTGEAQTTTSTGAATVGGWTLGAIGANMLTATVTGATFDGNPASFSATGEEVVVSPSQDTSITGTVAVTRLVIPAGRTVTASAAIVIVADSTIEINGTLRGPCLPITIKGSQVVNIRGTIDNSCAQEPEDPPNLIIDAEGGYEIVGATIATSGDLTITNDSTLTDAAFPAAPGDAGGSLRLYGSRAPEALAAMHNGPPRAGDDLPVDHGTCGVQDAVFPSPADRARNGLDAPFANPGKNGRLKSLWCRGNLAFRGGVEVIGQHGGHGGEGDFTSINNSETRGGNGGRGGNVKIRSYGVLSFAGDNRMVAGDGGNGGDATTVAMPNILPLIGPWAKARGGDGGAPGIVDMVALSEIRFFNPTTIRLGNAGHGGDAMATGADGFDAIFADIAQHGGDAEAIGGLGASGPGQSIIGGVQGPGFAMMQGGNAGDGGDATAFAGNGGQPTEDNKTGGNGGDITADAGNGGSSTFTNFAGVRVADGGDGGSATFRGGNGGPGWTNMCSAVDGFKPGGNGGNGGRGEGGLGTGGEGKANGSDGTVLVDAAGKAGLGGMGLPGGDTGGAADHIRQNFGHPQRTNVGNPFSRPTAFPCADFQPPHIVKTIIPDQNCSSGFLDPMTVRNWGPSPITAIINSMFLVPPVSPPDDPLSIAIVFGAGIVPPNGGTLLTGFLSPVVRVDCLKIVPFLACLRATLTLGPTNHVLTFPYRVRRTGDPIFDAPADRAACVAAG